MSKISLRQWMEENDFDTKDAVLSEYALESVVPALCDDACDVEPDGYCPHGAQSVLMAIGVI